MVTEQAYWISKSQIKELKELIEQESVNMGRRLLEKIERTQKTTLLPNITNKRD